MAEALGRLGCGWLRRLLRLSSPSLGPWLWAAAEALVVLARQMTRDARHARRERRERRDAMALSCLGPRGLSTA